MAAAAAEAKEDEEGIHPLEGEDGGEEYSAVEEEWVWGGEEEEEEAVEHTKSKPCT